MRKIIKEFFYKLTWMILIIIAFIFIPIILRGPVKRLFKKTELDPEYWFDDFVCNQYFDAQNYEVKSFSESTLPVNEDENLLPDFRFIQISTNYEFCIVSKFLPDLQEQIDWCNQRQFAFLKQIENLPVYIFLGLAGKPASPARIYLIPLKNIQSNVIDVSTLTEYEVKVGQPYIFPA